MRTISNSKIVQSLIQSDQSRLVTWLRNPLPDRLPCSNNNFKKDLCRRMIFFQNWCWVSFKMKKINLSQVVCCLVLIMSSNWLNFFFNWNFFSKIPSSWMSSKWRKRKYQTRHVRSFLSRDWTDSQNITFNTICYLYLCFRAVHLYNRQHGVAIKM